MKSARLLDTLCIIAGLSLFGCSSPTTATPGPDTGVAPVDGGVPASDVGSADAPPSDVGNAPADALPSDIGSAPPDAEAAPITGTLGALGAVQPIVSSLVISNSGETLLYLSTAPLSCESLQASRWLGAQPAGSQVLEVVMRGAPTAGQTVQVPPGEVNYAAGGRSSSYEVGATSGSITFTEATAGGVVAGTLRAAYRSGSAIAGSFRAEFCANGQQY
jgi:hypothetical protein